MGTSSDVHCFACGYDTFLMVGGGMTNHRTYAAWPVMCKACAAITTANFKEQPLVCGKCESADVSPMAEHCEPGGSGEVALSWGDLKLTDGRYRCPKCGKFELRFGTDAGEHGLVMWD